MSPLRVLVRRVRTHASPLPLPRYQSAGAAGLDLYADIEGEWTLAPLARRAVPSGLAIALPEGHEAQVRPRSGLALRHGITCINAPGTIDSDYRGEIQVLLVNLSGEPYTLRRGERIAQLVVAPVSQAALEEVDELPTTARMDGGFGSTGR
jgi:dUTP pyrophosphatase